MNILEKIEKLIKEKITKLYDKDIDVKLEFPPNIELGDFTINCFLLAKELELNPQEIARAINEQLKSEEIFESAVAQGPYINIKIKSRVLLELLDKVPVESDEASKKKLKVMVEYLQPNTNKPLHLGHARNGALGMALSNILEANGYEVVKANLINDRGVHICKSMLAWMKWGQGETPESSGMKGDHLVGKYYVKFSQEAKENPGLEKEAQEMLKKWEEGEPEITEIWKKMNGWVIEGFEQTNKEYGFEFDKIYFESETYKLGRDIVMEGFEKGIFKKDEVGNIVYYLPEKKFGLDKDGKQKLVTVLRADGTSLYVTQDLGTANEKFRQFALDKSIHVVGNEQDYHFEVLFDILKGLGMSWAESCYHLSYGMVTLPSGKMKSREGTVVDADDLLVEMKEMAKEEIRKRELEIASGEMEERSRKVAIAAIKFFLLKATPKNDICFNPEESISFDGFTGPYCQYAYARATKIVEKVGEEIDKTDDYELNSEERLIIQKINNFLIQKELAAEERNPAKVASATYELGVVFNRFYQKHSVINADTAAKTARLKIVGGVRKYLKDGLGLLGIEVLEEM